MTDLTFKTTVGTFLGWRDGGVIRITGIPYALAARYQPPQEYKNQESELPFDATKWSPACPQTASPILREVLGMDMLKNLHQDEHCQFLSITRPDGKNTNATLPVMVWIYGGSYVTGAGDTLVYDPALLVSEQQVIVVNINYRTGLFGFLGGYRDIPANLGLMDMIAALRWVKKHIAAFGGDTENITLFGQSAGGDAIAHLMMADDVKGLFQRAIIQSAPLGIRKGKEHLTKAMIEVATPLSKEASVKEMLAVQDKMLFSLKRFGLKGGMPFGVQYGHPPLPPENQAVAVWRTRAPQWDVLIGWTARETALFAPYIPTLQQLAALPWVGKAALEWLIGKTSDWVYRDAGKSFAQLMASAGSRVYQYEMHWGAKENIFRDAHVADIPLLFGQQALWEGAVLCKGKSPDELQHAGKIVRTMWAAFARTGNLANEEQLPEIIGYHRVKA